MEATQHSFSNQSQVVTTPFEGYEQNDGKPKMSSTYYNKTSKTKKISPMHKTKQNMKKTHNVLGSEFQQKLWEYCHPVRKEPRKLKHPNVFITLAPAEWMFPFSSLARLGTRLYSGTD